MTIDSSPAFNTARIEVNVMTKKNDNFRVSGRYLEARLAQVLEEPLGIILHSDSPDLVNSLFAI